MQYIGKRFNMSGIDAACWKEVQFVRTRSVCWREIQYVRNRCSMLERDLVCQEEISI